MSTNKRHVVEETFIQEKLLCVVVLTEMGHRCGYVGIPPEHPYYHKDPTYQTELNVHGGVTWCERNHNGYPVKTTPILKFIGFDCAHSMDGKDFKEANKHFKDSKIYKSSKRMEKFLQAEARFKKIVRTKKYVIDQCKLLAEQLNKLPTI